MPSQKRLEKYADLAVRMGANVQKNQSVIIRTSTDSLELAREIQTKAYLAGAKRVRLDITDAYASRTGLDHMDVETLKEVPDWVVSKYQLDVDQGACLISITSPIPEINKGVAPDKMQQSAMAMMQKLAFFREHTMGNRTQWTIVAASNPAWATKIFPDLPAEEATEKLWGAIFDATRIYEDQDPVALWEAHNKTLAAHNKVLNDYQFKHLHFKNSLGTDLIVELVKDHVWAGGQEKTTHGHFFNPNIPTEESFTMPFKPGTRGKVFASKPLDYQGNLIDGFWLEFKDGKVVDFDAKAAKDSLENLLNFDDGARYIGEIALIQHDSPIQNTGLLFYNTLFDENASCHMALGRAYPMNVKGGTAMSQDELDAVGANNSMTHVDFMFGTTDLNVTGLTHDGKEVPVMRNGNFVI
jgi:aminopeptidase